MANAGTVLSRENSCPLSLHGPSQRLPWLSCRRALHPRRAAAEVFGDWEHTLPKGLEQLFAGKAAPRGWDTHEPVGWSTPPSRREAAPCQKISAGPSSRFARLSERNLVCLCWRALAQAALKILCIRQLNTFGKSISAPRNNPSIH